MQRSLRRRRSARFLAPERAFRLTAEGLLLAAVLGSGFAPETQAALSLDPTRVMMHEGDGDLRTTVQGVPSAGFDVQTVNIHNYNILEEPFKSALDVMDFPNAAYVFGETTSATVLPGYAYGTVLPDTPKPWFIGEFGPGAVINNPHAQAFFNGDACYEDLFGQR